MKLIVSEFGALAGYVSREFHLILSTLVNDYGWKNVERYELWKDSGSLEQRLSRRFDTLPEVILFWEGYDFIEAHRRELAKLDCRHAVFADDLHKERPDNSMRRSFEFCDLILSAYANVFDGFFPGVSAKTKLAWTPHSASPDFWLDFNSTAENKILLSGAINNHYPLRMEMKTLHEKYPSEIPYHPHPGYHCRYRYDRQDDVVGVGYATVIRANRAAFTDALKYRYLVAKHFEIPATGALLLADKSMDRDLEELGFIENTHYVAATFNNLEDRVRFLLDPTHHEDLDRIRKNGQALVMDRHKTTDRASLIDTLCTAGPEQEKSEVGFRPPLKPSMENVYLRMPDGGGLGDLICFLGSARVFANRYPQKQVFTNILPAIIERYQPPNLIFHSCSCASSPNVFKHHRTKHESPFHNYAGTFLASMGETVTTPPAIELPDLEPMPGLPSGSYIALQPFSGAAENPPEPDRFLQNLVNACHQFAPDLSVICVGDPKTRRGLTGVNYDHLSGPRGMLKAIQHSAAVLTPRSASAHIAAAYQKPAFLWLPNDGENWHLDYPNWVNSRIGIKTPEMEARTELQSFFRELEY